ncbi:MAG: AbrB/MazE/SpoVT family DNA-binding domain-containing protein [Dokdonella sp.]|uniref:AbrB/MazE/SpoVT family DNA-binding domain-containing protein n=1 Tax=Dokdonella sp. TaxID=2291710 RepID=UPI0025B8623D|nr:AbrB/MazE/SpoVT family DNA-binding domain-containing protein [Dokdonella sp.]MBZ0222417.1 AbrB/MazE/SpoVT family DNA-binding domain-containing protein [Dokdonella sp.]MCC7255019.1 AbrB/MazE/SpoVT family DNA-binding domain-containing protein [Dokdonella sp.]
MNALTITAKGQVTLKRDILKHLGAKPGQKVVAETIANGKVVLTLDKGEETLNAAFGMLKAHNKRKKPLTLAEINKASAKSWAGERE